MPESSRPGAAVVVNYASSHEVNNAGIYRFGAIEEVTEDGFLQQFNTNVLGLLLATKAAVAQFGPKGGSVINITLGIICLKPPGTSIYTATKAAVDAITRALAKELGPRKIRVNAIAPGVVQTEGTRAALIGGDFEAGFFCNRHRLIA